MKIESRDGKVGNKDIDIKTNPLKTIIIIVIIILAVILGNVGLNLWDNLHYKPLYQKYLSERYSESMVISNINWDIWKRQGTCFVSLKTGPDLGFYTYIRQKGIFGGYVFSDDYFVNLWDNQIQDEVTGFTSKVYNNLVSVESQMDLTSEDSDPFQYAQLQYYKSYKSKSVIPTFQQVKDSPALKKLYKTLSISIEGDLIHSDKNIEYEKVFKVLEFIKQKNYKFDYIEILYGTGTKSNFTTEGDNILFFSEIDIESLNTLDEFKKRLEQG